ncbi:MAG: membrane protein insertase YidC [Bacteroidota bacterium]
MNKGTINTIIGILLIFGVLIGYSVLTAPSKEEKQKKKRYDDSMMFAQKQKIINDSLEIYKKKAAALVKDSAIKVTVKDTASAVIKNDSTNNSSVNGKFSTSASGKNKHIVIETDLVKIKFASKGGGISYVELKKYKTFDKKPLILFNTDTSNFFLTFQSDYKFINTSGLFFTPYFYNKAFQGKDSVVISGKDSVQFAMRLYPNATDSTKAPESYLEFLYTLDSNYMMHFNINFVKMQQILDANSTYIALDWKLNLKQQEKSHKNEHVNTTVYFKPAQDDVDYLKETKDDKKDKIPDIKWVSMKQQFFSSTLISKTSFLSANIESMTRKDTIFPGYLKTVSASLTLPYSNTDKLSYPMSFYFGPNHYKTLRKYNLDLERQIPLGWSSPYILGWINRWMVIPVFDFLSKTGMNYGIIILILTILLKIVLFPIAYKTYMSSARMRVLKPEVDEIGKKFPKKEDAMKKQQETMKLYKKAGINPMAGCIPMLLQMPILIALYRFFPASIELRQESFLWATDLSSYDSIWNFGFTIPFYGDHMSLFTLLMTVSTVIYTKMNNQMMGTNNQPGMKFVMYAMPVMFLGFFNDFASALSYYYLLANLITFLQMYLFRKFINEDKIHARIQENRKKPVKASGFQKRLEDMAKKRGYSAKK